MGIGFYYADDPDTRELTRFSKFILNLINYANTRYS
jgi:hypothetical protein